MATIGLAYEEMLVAAVAGSYRRIRSISRGKKDRHGHSGRDVWSMDIEGALAEMALAKHLGVYWSGSIVLCPSSAQSLSMWTSSPPTGSNTSCVAAPSRRRADRKLRPTRRAGCRAKRAIRRDRGMGG